MSNPVYCILSAGAVHCVPVVAFSTVFQDTPAKLARNPPVNSQLEGSLTVAPIVPPAILKIKNRNLLYTLNNPSLSDLESDVSRKFSNDSQTPDDENHSFDVDAEHLEPGFGQALPTRWQVLSPKVSDDELQEAPSSDEQGTSVAPNIAKHYVRGPQNKLTSSPNNSQLFIKIDTTEDSPKEKEIISILNDYSTHAVYLPQYFVDLQTNLDSHYTQIRTLLTKIFPSWSLDITVKRLTGGITNMLLSCSHLSTNQTLLMRVYGQGTNLIIDRNREFVSHLVLNSIKLAPPIHARFLNGLIYGYLPGRSLEPNELSNGAVYPFIAQQLGNWHSRINCEYIEDGVEKLRKYTAGLKKQYEMQTTTKSKLPKKEKKHSKLINNIWDLIEDWILIVPENEALVEIFSKNLKDKEVNCENIRDTILEEFRWLRLTLKSSTKSSVVVSHCDLLSGNIIIPEDLDLTKNITLKNLPSLDKNPIQFIDYEYMLPAPRAFDIANHFAEWQGFDCNRSLIPEPSATNEVMVEWCKAYLNDSTTLEEKVNSLIDEISCYYGMPGFYWGIWAMIQSELSTIDFNYAHYSELRLQEYWLWKENFLRTHN